VCVLCVCVYGRSKQSAERPAQAADEGSVCGVVSDSSRPTQFSVAVSANADGSTRLGSQWLTDAYQPGFTPSLSIFTSSMIKNVIPMRCIGGVLISVT